MALLAAVAFAVGLAVGRWWALRAQHAFRSMPGASPYRVPAEVSGEFVDATQQLTATAMQAGAKAERADLLVIVEAVRRAVPGQCCDRTARAIVEAIEARGAR